MEHFNISKEVDTAKIVTQLDSREEAKIKYEIVNGADHFFRDQIDKFQEISDKLVLIRSCF